MKNMILLLIILITILNNIIIKDFKENNKNWNNNEKIENEEKELYNIDNKNNKALEYLEKKFGNKVDQEIDKEEISPKKK